jgi:hypothetical protein
MFTSKMRTAIAVLAAAFTIVALGLSAAPADATIGSMTATLSIERLPGTARVCSTHVQGVVRMTQAEAGDLLNKQDYRVIFRVWGDDPVSDDFITGPHPLSTAAESQGLTFRGFTGLPCSKLDEDGGTFDTEGDEIYAGVRLVKGYRNGVYGPTLRSDETNRINGRF